MKILGAFLVGLLIGAGVVTLVPRWRPSPAVRVAEDSARAARADANTAKAVARAAVDSLAAWRPIVEEALARPPRVRVGVLPGTVIIPPATPADTERVVVVPPEVVDQLKQDSATIFSLREERVRSQAAIARLEEAGRVDALADAAAGHASALARADLEDQLAQARRDARWWRLAGKAVLVVGGVVLVEKGVAALTR